MAQVINKGFYEGKSLLVEAPTGTGKTLAYLIPMACFRRENPTQRFVISVSTKHLQAQIEKDLARFSEEFPELKQSAVLKGASNYLCLNRLKRASRKPNNKQVDQESGRAHPEPRLPGEDAAWMARGAAIQDQ